MSIPDPSDTGEFVAAEEAVELPAVPLAEYLAAQGMHLSTDTAVRQFAHGFGNVNYLLEVDGEPCVLRRPPAGLLPVGGNDMAREHRVRCGLNGAFPLAPRGLHLCEDASVIGVPFVLMEYRSGRVIRSVVPQSLKGREVELSRMLIDTLASLHRVDPDAVGLGDLGRPEGFLSRTAVGWVKRADVACHGTPPAAVDEIHEWLEDNMLTEPEPCLIHGDYKLNNIVVDHDDPLVPRAVLDWDMSTRGDPLFDLATLLSYWVEPGDPDTMLELDQMPTHAGGFMTRQQAAEYYAEVSSIHLSDFIFYRVLAMFKLGVVFLQLHSRYRRGLTTDRRFARFRKVAEGILDFTLVVAAGKVF